MINGYIDLRSDTVTHPTAAMREAMANAELGDDVFGDDPTVLRLQEMAAERMGHEAALLVSSGTMGNLCAVLTHCGRGHEVIAGESSHLINNEQGGMAALGGLIPRAVPNQPDGSMRLDDVADAIQADDQHLARSGMISLENTNNSLGGAVLDAKYTRALAELAKRHDLKFHIDGARIFNASTVLGVPVSDLTKDADSVSFCLSKGLSAPVGSLLCGSKEFVDEAFRVRKVLGGGMRQAGVIAAAGIVALETMTDRLAEDHANAKRLAQGLADTIGFTLDPERVQSNMVYFALAPDVSIDTAEVRRRLLKQGVRVGGGERGFRAVTHAWVSTEEIDRALLALRTILTSNS